MIENFMSVGPLIDFQLHVTVYLHCSMEKVHLKCTEYL